MTQVVDPQSLLREAADCHQRGDIPAAEGMYRKLLARAPHLHVACHLLALIEFSRGAVEEAESLWRRAIESAPDEAIYRNNLGEVLRRGGAAKAAVLQFRFAVALRTDFAEAWLNLGLALHAIGDLYDADFAFILAWESNPQLIVGYLHHARLLQDIGDTKRRLSLLEKAADMSQGDPASQAEIKLLIGDCLKEKGDFATAKQSYAEAAGLNEAEQLYRANNVSFSYAACNGYYRLSATSPSSSGKRAFRVALLAPADHYLNTLWGMKRAFEKRGVECLVGWPLLGPESMRGMVEAYRPDLVLEINRTRNQAEGLPASVLHVCWAQDGTHAFGQDASRFGGSNRVYFLAHPDTLGYDPALLNQPDTYDVLLPAIDPEVYRPIVRTAYDHDFAFAGYIPAPPLLPLEIMTNFMYRSELIQMNWIEMETLFRKANIRQWSVGDCAYENIRLHLASYLGWSPDELHIPDDAYRNFTWLMRIMDRADMLRQALRVSRRLSINGPDTWMRWPEFAPHYKGMLHEAEALADSYRASELVLHNGVSALHPRSFECLACGAALLVNRCYTDDKPGSIHDYFEPGVHYLEYEIDHAEEAFREALGDKPRLAKLRLAAATEVAARHTWQHRIDKLLADIGQGLDIS